MEFGIFNAACLLPRYVEQHGASAEHDRIMDEVAFIVAADKAGFKYTWASEHHFLTEYSHLSASESFLAFCAAKTSNIHIGSGIFNITPPVNHPARIAERVAMLDHLSEGRFEFGTGRGSSTTEQKGFGIKDSELTREMVAETLPQIVRMWKDEDYSYDGKFFSMPKRNVLPKPYSKPHPAIWMAAGSPSTFDLAAELGVGVLCFGFSTPDQLTPLVARYKEKIGDCKNPVGGFVNDNVMITTTMICMEDGAKARKTFLEADSNYHLSLVFRYLDTFPKPPGVPEWPEIVPAMDAASLDAVIASGDVAVGTPEEVSKAIGPLRRHRCRPAVLRHAVQLHVDRVVRGGGGDLRQAPAADVRQGPDPPHHHAAPRRRRFLSYSTPGVSSISRLGSPSSSRNSPPASRRSISSATSSGECGPDVHPVALATPCCSNCVQRSSTTSASASAPACCGSALRSCTRRCTRSIGARSTA